MTISKSTEWGTTYDVEATEKVFDDVVKEALTKLDSSIRASLNSLASK
ncbi:MAG: hypothetical protein ACI9TV_003011 [Sulfurimonas sp.]|jgi:hypothetical protein